MACSECRHSQADRNRGYRYLHSTFCDLVISGVAGLRPERSSAATLVVEPLLPAGDSLPWFALDNVLFRGHEVAVGWDVDGSHLQLGQGLAVWVDSCLAARRADLGRLEVSLQRPGC